MAVKWIVAAIIIVVLLIGGYAIYQTVQVSNKYQRTLQSELNPSDFHVPGTQTKEYAETYNFDNSWYRVQIMEFGNINLASEGISKLKESLNPAMIILKEKYVNYKEITAQNHLYFYQSDKFIISIDTTSSKDEGDEFVTWYYSKYPNK